MKMILTCLETNEKLVIGDKWRILKNGTEGFTDFEREVHTSDNALVDGGFYHGDHVAIKERTVSVGYLGFDLKEKEEERGRVLSLLTYGGTYRLNVSHRGRRVYSDGHILKFKLSKTDHEPSMLTCTFTLIFENPYWKSLEVFEEEITNKRPMIGFPYISPQNASPQGSTGGIYLFNQELEFVNNGDTFADLYVEMVALGKVENPEIIINERKVTLIDNLQKDDTLIFDFTLVPPRITKNGQNVLGKADRRSNFSGMKMAQGINHFKYNAKNGTGNLVVTLKYNEQFGAI